MEPGFYSSAAYFTLLGGWQLKIPSVINKQECIESFDVSDIILGIYHIPFP